MNFCRAIRARQQFAAVIFGRTHGRNRIVPEREIGEEDRERTIHIESKLNVHTELHWIVARASKDGNATSGWTPTTETLLYLAFKESDLSDTPIHTHKKTAHTQTIYTDTYFMLFVVNTIYVFVYLHILYAYRFYL